MGRDLPSVLHVMLHDEIALDRVLVGIFVCTTQEEQAAVIV
jgi:hypothetical protein